MKTIINIGLNVGQQEPETGRIKGAIRILFKKNSIKMSKIIRKYLKILKHYSNRRKIKKQWKQINTNNKQMIF